MAELFQGQAGSPITYLASDISANQTTISIADDSALPDAPNICTIGYGEQLETIKYETKSNGVLQNVTRGIEGTPRAWQAGTEVARFFTAYDHNSIIENFNSHLVESAYYKPLTNDDNVTIYRQRAVVIDRQSYYTVFDLQGEVELLSGSLIGTSVYARLTIDGKVMFSGSADTYYNAKTDGGQAYSVFTLPRSLSKNSMKLEIYNSGASTREFAYIVIVRE